MELKLNPKTHEYSIGDRLIPSVTSVLKSAGLIDGRWFDQDSAIRGTYVHKAIELYHKQGLNFKALDALLKPYVIAYMDFLVATGFRPILIERPVYDSLYDYAGTPDLIGYFMDSLAIIDIKTGAIPAWAGPQLAAYARAVGKTVENKPIRNRYVLQLKSNRKWNLKQFRSSKDISVFLAALTVYNFKEKRL